MTALLHIPYLTKVSKMGEGVINALNFVNVVYGRIQNRVKTILVLLEANQMEIKGVTHFKNFDRYNANFYIIYLKCCLVLFLKVI